VDCFDNALGFIKQAVESGGSKAAYLHGSFGSGKSHFMAVLNLLLAGNTQARATPSWRRGCDHMAGRHGKKFLLVPYHMIGAKRHGERPSWGSTPSTCANYTHKHRFPASTWPKACSSDAQRMREQMGDAAFFAKLNEGSGGYRRHWRVAGATWTLAGMPPAFDAATMEAPNGEERSRLVGDLIGKFFSAYRSLAGERRVVCVAG
jgi:hypothetical protein